MKSVKYYEESLDYVHVRHNFLTRLNSYNFEICGSPCADDLERLPTQTQHRHTLGHQLQRQHQQ